MSDKACSKKYENITLSFYNSDIHLDDILASKLGSFIKSKKILSSQQSKKYLEKCKEYTFTTENVQNFLIELRKALYLSKGWWYKFHQPSELNLPDHDRIDYKRKPHSGTVYAALNINFSAGNFINPQTFTCKKNLGIMNMFYFPAERKLEILDGHTKFQFKKEIFDDFCLLDVDPVYNDHQTVYIIVKRAPVVIQSRVKKDCKYVQRKDRRDFPFIEDSFVYRFVLTSNQNFFSPFVKAVQIPYYFASLVAAEEKSPVVNQSLINLNSQLSYLLAVLKSNKYTRFGKTYIPQAFVDRLSQEFNRGNEYWVEYLVDQALKLQEFDDYEHLINIDLSKLPKFNPNTLPNYHVLVKSAYVTPSRVIFKKPHIQLSNRCLRLYGSDRFMTVQFTEEDLQPLNVENQDLLEEYIRHVLINGITVPGLGVFYYLGNSHSQARNCRSWFYCVKNNEKVEETLSAVRKSLIGNDPEWTARKVIRCMGLVFPSTIPTIHVDHSLIHYVEDIEMNGHNFTEGTGYIGQETAKRVCASGNYPLTTSAFQIRLGGSKGVLSVHPTIQEGIFLRDSMNKFKSNPNNIHDRILEVISISGPKTCYLNRQIINLFSELGVPNKYFVNVQQQALNKLAKNFTDLVTYKRILSGLSWSDSALEEIDLAVDDPLIGNALQSYYTKSLDKIRDKCSVPIEYARTLMGISDESGQLKPKQVYIQVSHKDGGKEVIVGKVLVCKNPCLHPGDVRVLEAVSLPALENVYIDVIAFSQQGKVPNFKECSGSDLDGDRYFVWFDPELVDLVTEQEPFLGKDLPAAPEKIFEGSRIELVEQYLLNINKGALGRIALSHMALCDLLSPTHSLCVELAKQHFIEVDADKTGVHGKVPKEVTSQEYLDNNNRYPQFMMSSVPKKTYWYSRKVLGKLFQSASVLKAVPEFEPEMYLDQSRLINGYEDYVEDAKNNYKSYKYEINSLLNQHNIEKEEDMIVDFIKESVNSFYYLQLHVYEMRKNYERIQRAFKVKFLHEFPGNTFDEKLSSSNDKIKRKISAWYYVSYSDNEPDHTLSFFWIVKCLEPKRKQKSAPEPLNYMSQSIINLIDDSKNTLLQSYSERTLTANYLTRLLKKEGDENFIDSEVLVFGSSSMLLFDPSKSTVDFYIKVNPSVKQQQQDDGYDSKLKMIEIILKSDPSTPKNIKYCQSVEASSEQPLIDANNTKYIKKTAVPKLQFKLNETHCALSTDPSGFLKTSIICRIIESNPMIFQVLFTVIRWGREMCLLVKTLEQINSRKITAWSLIWMVVHFFNEKGLLDLSQINLDVLVENKSVEWWSNVLEKSRSQRVGQHLLNFFEYYSQMLCNILRNKEKGARLYLVCPLDEENMPSVDINPKVDEEHAVFLQEIFTIAHHTLATSGNIKVFFKRSVLEKKKNIILDQLVSRHIRGRIPQIISKISVLSDVDISIKEACNGCLEVKINGDPGEIHHAVDQLNLIITYETAMPIYKPKKFFPGGGTVLLFKSSKSVNDTVRLVKMGKEREKLCNIEHVLNDPRMQGVLKNPWIDFNSNDPLPYAKLEYEKVLFRQLEMCKEYTDESVYGRMLFFIRFGNIYFVNCPYEGAEMSIAKLQNDISYSRQQSINLETLKFDEIKNDCMQKKTEVPSLPTMQSNKRNYTKLTKSSFFPCIPNLSLDQICKRVEDLGWNQDNDPQRYQKSKNEEYVVCCKSSEQNLVQFKVLVRSDLRLPNTIRHGSFNWFVCDLTTSQESHSNLNDCDLHVRFAIQSRPQYDGENDRINEYEIKPIVKKCESEVDSCFAPIQITNEFKTSVCFIRHFCQVVYFNPPTDHPMSMYNTVLKIQRIKEYRNTGELYIEKVEAEIMSNLPSESEKSNFMDESWNLGLEIAETFKK